jgi:hypothetical protein
MRSGMFANRQTQLFYFPKDHPSMPSWFKGVEIIICERGVWPDTGLPKGLPAQCPEFKCPPNHVELWIAAAGTSFISNPILLLKNHSSRN